MKLVWTEISLQDRIGIFNYIAEDSFDTAVRIDDRIEDQANELERWPELGRSGRVSGTRELVITGTPYLVVYEVDVDTVIVSRVVHGAMQWASEMTGA